MSSVNGFVGGDLQLEKLTLCSAEVKDVAILLEHVDLLDALDRLDVELLQTGLDLPVVGCGGSWCLLDGASWRALAAGTLTAARLQSLENLWVCGAGKRSVYRIQPGFHRTVEQPYPLCCSFCRGVLRLALRSLLVLTAIVAIDRPRLWSIAAAAAVEVVPRFCQMITNFAAARDFGQPAGGGRN